MTDRNDVTRGHRAKTLLEDELVVAAFAAIEAGLHRGWESTQFDQADVREDSYRMLRAARAFKAQFEQMIRDGKVAEATIKAEEAKANRKANRDE